MHLVVQLASLFSEPNVNSKMSTITLTFSIAITSIFISLAACLDFINNLCAQPTSRVLFQSITMDFSFSFKIRIASSGPTTSANTLLSNAWGFFLLFSCLSITFLISSVR